VVHVLRGVLARGVRRRLHDGKMLVCVRDGIALDLAESVGEQRGGVERVVRGVRISDPVVALDRHAEDVGAFASQEAVPEEVVGSDLLVVVGVEVGEDVCFRVSAIQVLIWRKRC